MSDQDPPHYDDAEEARVRELFNARYPTLRRRGSNRRAVRRVIERAQGELWLRDVVTLAAAGLTRWLLALFAAAARSPLVKAAAETRRRMDAGTG